jgi:trk system potassium uptake protein TrkA
VANDILKYLLNPGSLAMETFAHGTVQMRTLRVPSDWKEFHIPLKSLSLPEGVILGLIKRNSNQEEKIIFPHGDDYILPEDEVTLIGEFDAITDVHYFFGIEVKRVRSVVIVGGSRTGISLAKTLEGHGIEVRLIEKKYEHCVKLAEMLPTCTILNHDGTDLDFFRSEKIGQSDVIVSCTDSDEVNLLSAMLGKEVGCQQGIVMLSNTSYISLISRLGIDYVSAPRISAANHILSQIVLTTVSSLVSLYNNQAEIMEINVSLNSKIVGIPLAELGPLLPKDFLIAMIQNRGKVMVAHGNRIISPGDTVIAITNAKYLNELETIF